MKQTQREHVPKQYLHPLTSAVARAAVGSSSVYQPVAAACIVPALPTAACAAVMPTQNYHTMKRTQLAFHALKSLIERLNML